MSVTKGVPIYHGSIELRRQPTNRRDGGATVTAATARGVVFRFCDASKVCPLVLNRALRVIPANLAKLDGWEVAELLPETFLGNSIEKQNTNGGE